jgi:hypothetical protein
MYGTEVIFQSGVGAFGHASFPVAYRLMGATCLLHFNLSAAEP